MTRNQTYRISRANRRNKIITETKERTHKNTQKRIKGTEKKNDQIISRHEDEHAAKWLSAENERDMKIKKRNKQCNTNFFDLLFMDIILRSINIKLRQCGCCWCCCCSGNSYITIVATLFFGSSRITDFDCNVGMISSRSTL